MSIIKGSNARKTVESSADPKQSLSFPKRSLEGNVTLLLGMADDTRGNGHKTASQELDIRKTFLLGGNVAMEQVTQGSKGMLDLNQS